jgi:hypothetical protein
MEDQNCINIIFNALLLSKYQHRCTRELKYDPTCILCVYASKAQFYPFNDIYLCLKTSIHNSSFKNPIVTKIKRKEIRVSSKPL